MFSLASKIETGTEGLTPSSTLVLTQIYHYVVPPLPPPPPNYHFIETTVLFCAHAQNLYHKQTLSSGNMAIWSCILTYSTCLWIYFVQRAALSHALSRSRTSMPALRAGWCLQPLPAVSSSMLVKLLWVKLKGRKKIFSPPSYLAGS